MKELRDWFLSNHRKLKFRETKEPYKIWVSEVMLQQTRVSAMLSSYERFMEKFPNVESLSNSTEEEVVSLWKGLGYYSRALNLRKGAIYITEKFDGKFPNDINKALSIPGVGQYTARAVLSIAYENPLAVLDGNVKRVLSRYFLFKKNINQTNAHKELQLLADQFLNKENPGDHNQAMMELGATICTMEPRCAVCPLQNSCLGFSTKEASSLPIKIKEKPKIDIELIFLVFRKENKLLITKSKNRRFFKTIYAIPFYIISKDLDFKNDFSQELKNMILKNRILTSKKHSITHHKIQLGYSEIPINFENEISGEKKWIEIDQIEHEFPSSISKKLKTFFESKS
ncbi:MAG: A/G-specific adenine glycosylase [Leptospiraceae bacterium]|nr:A/G-specific adenine glycosylase [Leptospiraceae bacterium]